VLLSVFSAVAALLAGLGIYRVVAYSVVQRTHKIGVRLALGATRAQVIALVLRQAVVFSGAGVGLGLLGA
jgi:ABC-type antimicrobial peptide transport system permease subunit